MIDYTNIEYNKWLPVWKKCRDTYDGTESIRAGGQTYLAALTGQDAESYDSYKNRAVFFNAVGRTVKGMSGAIMRKKPIITAPDTLAALIADFDMRGTTLIDFAYSIIKELAITNRVGILVDFPRASTVGMTTAVMESSGLRPYASIYKAENILDWRYECVGNRYMLTMIKLREIVSIARGDYTDTQELIRLLDLTPEGYRVRLYYQTKDGYHDYPDDEFFPLMNNAPLREIPFVFDNQISKPVLLDLVNINLAHYRNSADYEHGLHFTGLPTPIFWGANLADEQGNSIISLGSASAYGFPSADGHAEYLEFTGQGLGALKTAMDDKMQMMVALGSRYLGAEKRAAETAEAMTIRNAGENSIMSRIAQHGSEMMTKALMLMAQWLRVSGDIMVQINTDVNPTGITPQMLQQLTASYLSGAISYETYFANLQDGEVIANDRSIDDERLAIQDGGMAGVAQ